MITVMERLNGQQRKNRVDTFTEVFSIRKACMRVEVKFSGAFRKFSYDGSMFDNSVGSVVCL